MAFSNSSWYGIGSSYSGADLVNTTDNFPASSDIYYILNFNNIFNSYSKFPGFYLTVYPRWSMIESVFNNIIVSLLVTLFVLMIVNNWFIIMVSPSFILVCISRSSKLYSNLGYMHRRGLHQKSKPAGWFASTSWAFSLSCWWSCKLSYPSLWMSSSSKYLTRPRKESVLSMPNHLNTAVVKDVSICSYIYMDSHISWTVLWGKLSSSPMG